MQPDPFDGIEDDSTDLKSTRTTPTYRGSIVGKWGTGQVPPTVSRIGRRSRCGGNGRRSAGKANDQIRECANFGRPCGRRDRDIVKYAFALTRAPVIRGPLKHLATKLYEKVEPGRARRPRLWGACIRGRNSAAATHSPGVPSEGLPRSAGFPSPANTQA